jgi:hypothetical protein
MEAILHSLVVQLEVAAAIFPAPRPAKSRFVVADLKGYHRGWLLMANAMTRPGVLTSAVPYLRWRSK